MVNNRGMIIWVVLIIAIVALVVAACSAHKTTREAEHANGVAFIPDPKNDKVIIVKGWDEDELRKVIGDFVNTYKNDGYAAYFIEPQKQTDKIFRLTFPNDIHPLLFTFLINYVAYPFDLDFSQRSIVVGGKTTLSSLFEGIDPSLVGQKAILYLPKDDQDHTIVYMHTTSGTNFANSFSELVWRRVNDARLSTEVQELMNGN